MSQALPVLVAQLIPALQTTTVGSVLVPISTNSNTGWTVNGAASVHEALAADDAAHAVASGSATLSVRLG